MSKLNMFSSNLTSKLLASSLLLAGIVGFAPQAKAADFVFSGTVATTCAFGTIPSTTLTANTTTRILSGTTGSTTVSCNKVGATLAIDSVTQDVTNPAAISTLGTNLTAQANLTGVTTATLNATGTTPSAAQVLTIGDTNVAVTLNANLSSDTAVLPAGNYTYTVVMTITP